MGVDIKQILKEEALWWTAESTRGSVLVIDTNECVVFANSVAYEICGLNPETTSIVGLHIEDIFSYTGFQREVSPVLSCLATGRPSTNNRRSTEIGDYIVDASPIYYEGQLIGAVALTYNVTDLERARQDLAEITIRLADTENKYMQHRDTMEWLVESSPLCIVTVDNNGIVTTANSSFLELIGGAAKADVVGFPFSQALGAMGIPKEQSVVYKALQGTAQRARHFIGDRTLEVSAYRITNPHTRQVVGAVAMATDITDKVNMDAELMRLDRLNLVGELAASIAHEIRNPMTTVRGFLQLLQRKPELTPYKQFTDLMIEELDRANTIITNYLSLSKSTVSTEPANLSTVINSFAPVLDAEAAMHDMSITYTLLAKQRANINAAEIKQLVINLTKNAFESMHDAPGNTVGIRTVDSRDKIGIIVEDTGKGIPAELLPRLGTPFLTTKTDGTGLGLAVCYRIAERHNARIDVFSSDSGTTFTIWLPAVSPGCLTPAMDEG